MKKYWPVLLLVCMVLLSACDGRAGKNFDQPELYTFTATILEVHDNCFMVTPDEGSSASASSDKIEVPSRNAERGVDFAAGDRVLITYDGMIQELYPARLPQVYKIEKLMK